MKYLGLVLSLLMTNSFAEPIGLATEPNASFELLSRELAPIISYLKLENKSSNFVRTRSIEELFKKTKNREINLVYMGSGVAQLLVKHFGFIPLLTSLEGTQLAIISKAGGDYQLLKNDPNASIYYVHNDLYSQFWMQSLSAQAKLISFRNTERVMFSVLKNKKSLGAAFVEDLGLIMEQLNKTLSIHEIMNFGKIYLLASPSLIRDIPDLQEKMLSFHNNWIDPQKKYHYLNYFHFGVWKASDMQDMLVSDAFQDFLNTIKVK